MNRRELLQLTALGVARSAAGATVAADAVGPFEFANKSIKVLQAEMKSGALTSAQLTDAYAKRIEQLKPTLHAVLEVNPEALPTAEMRTLFDDL